VSLRHRLNALTARTLDALGYTVVPNWRMGSFAFTQHLRKLFEWLEIDCVLDVGANTGQYYDLLRRDVGYRGWVISFEPIPEHVAALRRRAAHEPAWRIEGMALGATAGRASFNVMVGTQFSSFLVPDHSATTQFLSANAVRETIDVAVHTLDEVLPGLARELAVRRFYLKLDTQGFDLEVVKGAHASLPGIRALQTEASVTPIYRGSPDFATTIRELQQCGFELSGIFPNNPDHFPRMLEFDCCMVQRAHLPADG
jgi:FkbM family methyltransferase